MALNFRDVLVEPSTAHYSISGQTGAMAAGAATKLIWYCRWTSSTSVALIRHVELEGVIATTAFAVGQVLYTMSFARAFTAENGTPGGTALTITGPNQRLVTPEPVTGMGVVRIASTAALGAPTWTLDSNPLSSINSHSSAGVNGATPIVGSQYIGPDGVLYHAEAASNEMPIILHQNEGLAINVTVPATGVWTASVQMRWSEADRVAL